MNLFKYFITFLMVILPYFNNVTFANNAHLLPTIRINISVYYLQPIALDGDLHLTDEKTVYIGAVKPNYEGAFKLGVGYEYKPAQYLNLDYFHISTKANKSVLVGETLEDINVPIPTHIALSAGYSVNQVDFAAGHDYAINMRSFLHPQFGLRWAKLSRESSAFENFSNTYSIPNETIYGVGSRIQKSSFAGLGPRVALTDNYLINSAWNLSATLSASILYGNIHSSEDDFTAIEIITPSNSMYGSATMHFNHTRKRIVPIIDANLGINYHYVLNKDNNSTITVSTGWNYNEYFNAVDKISADLSGIKNTSIIFQGPYIKIEYQL